MPPPRLIAWFPEMVLLVIVVRRELGVLVNVNIPPPIPPTPPVTCVAWLFSTWLPLIDMREFCDTQMPPPPAATPDVVSTAELPCTMLLVNVASPLLGLVKLKMAIPAPLPFVVSQFCKVTLVRVRLALPLDPVSYSMQPPSPSLPCVPRLCPFWIVRLDMLAVALVMEQFAVPRSSLTFITMSTPFAGPGL